MPERYECPQADCEFAARAPTEGQLSAMVEKHVRDRHAGIAPSEPHEPSAQ